MTSSDPAFGAPSPEDATSTAPSGVDLARVALQAAKAGARKRGEQPGAGKPGRARTRRSVRGNGREPLGLAAAFQQLVTERAWEIPAAGGTVLQQWPAIAPDLAAHVRAVGFDAGTGGLDLLPESPAYATQLRMSTARLIALANQAAGREAVRSIRVLPPGTHISAPAVDVSPAALPESAGPVRTREDASDGYRQALAAHQAARPGDGDRLAPAVRAAIERQDQMLQARREPEEEFGDGQAALEQMQARVAREAAPDRARARALQRLADERAGRAAPAVTVRRTGDQEGRRGQPTSELDVSVAAQEGGISHYAWSLRQHH
ncbi:DciA family protein [Streptomyces sp. NRRL F-5123]|uniref:DciA family protein n=1 Tax=Streptomyces sp. NRRL F-5123 TaxID=1463856 RepID=UPI0007C5D553|nr:DciA family protein [Streptomyces sp. NRRL F-5123]